MAVSTGANYRVTSGTPRLAREVQKKAGGDASLASRLPATGDCRTLQILH